MAVGRADPLLGVQVKDVISESAIFVVCAFAPIWRVYAPSTRKSGGPHLRLPRQFDLCPAARFNVVAAPVLRVLPASISLEGAVVACLVGCLGRRGHGRVRPIARKLDHRGARYRVSPEEC